MTSEFRILLVGDRSVLKLNYINKLHPQWFWYNVYGGVATLSLKTNHGDIRFRITFCIEREYFQSISEYLQRANGAIVMFDHKTSIEVESWLSDIRMVDPRIPITLCTSEFDATKGSIISFMTRYTNGNTKINCYQILPGLFCDFICPFLELAVKLTKYEDLVIFGICPASGRAEGSEGVSGIEEPITCQLPVVSNTKESIPCQLPGARLNKGISVMPTPINVVVYDEKRKLYKEVNHNFIVVQISEGLIAVAGKAVSDTKIIELTEDEKSIARKIGIYVFPEFLEFKLSDKDDTVVVSKDTKPTPKSKKNLNKQTNLVKVPGGTMKVTYKFYPDGGIL
jgi:hypothetical protein